MWFVFEEDIVEQFEYYLCWNIELIMFIMWNGIEFWCGNIIKYVICVGYKKYEGKDMGQSEVIDFCKVICYCEMCINQINGEFEF